MQPVWLIGFLALAIGLITFLVVAGRRQQKEWLTRAEALRALALRRNAVVDAFAADASTLLPMREFKNDSSVRRVEIPVVVRGRAQDVEYRLFDMRTDRPRRMSSKDPTPQSAYASYVTVTRSDGAWPRFEFVVIADVAEDSLTGKLMEAAGTLAVHTRFKGLTHVPIPHRPGFQLFVADASTASAMTDLLMKTFDHKTGWSVAALDRTVALSHGRVGASAMKALVPLGDLDAFLDEAISLERGLRQRSAP